MGPTKVVWTTSIGGLTGATPQAMLVAEKLKARNISVVLMHVPPIGLEYNAPYISVELENGVKGIYPTKSVAAAVEAINPDIVVVHTFNVSIYQDLSRLQANYPVLLRLGINMLELLMLPQYHDIIPFIVSAIRRVDHVIAASWNTGMQARALVKKDANKVSIIHTAIDPSKYKRHGKSKDPMITCLGRVFPVKNHITLIEAFNLVKEKVPDAQLAIVGSGKQLGPMVNNIMQQLELEYDKDYKFTGHMDDLNLLFKETRVFVLPSFSENLPQSVLQAYATGVPCVVSDCGWGYSFKAAAKANHDSPHKFAEQICILLTSDAEWNVVRDRQFKELETHFNLEIILDQYETLFKAYLDTESYLAGQEETVKERLQELGIRVKE